MRTIYLDNAATSFPKPEGVSSSMKAYMDCVGATINRSVYGSAQDAGLVTLQLREALARIFHFPEPATHVILTPGATFGLNMVIKGLLKPGDHASSAAWSTTPSCGPCCSCKASALTRIPCSREGLLDPGDVERLIRPNTRLLIMAHGSNVCGCVQDAPAVGEICARRGIPFLLDAAQTAGHYPVDFEAFQLSALAVPGHKGLLGPSGIGAVLLRDSLAKQLTRCWPGVPEAPRTANICPPTSRTVWSPAPPTCPVSMDWRQPCDSWSGKAWTSCAVMRWTCAAAFWPAWHPSPGRSPMGPKTRTAGSASSLWIFRTGTTQR